MLRTTWIQPLWHHCDYVHSLSLLFLSASPSLFSACFPLKPQKMTTFPSGSTCSSPGPGLTHLRIKNHAFGLVGLVGLIVKPWHGQKIPEMEATQSHVAGEETGFDSSPTNLLGSQPSALWPARIFFTYALNSKLDLEIPMLTQGQSCKAYCMSDSACFEEGYIYLNSQCR